MFQLYNLRSVNSFKYFLVFLLFVGSCKKEEEPQLSLKKQRYNGSLRMDGYYYLDISTDTEERILSYILYRDGTVLYGGAPLRSDIANREMDYNNGKWSEVAENEKTFWGIFQVNNQEISFDQWYIRDGKIFTSYQNKGTILNDSTFLITSTTREGLEGVILTEKYHFKSLENKPDSLNDFLN